MEEGQDSRGRMPNRRPRWDWGSRPQAKCRSGGHSHGPNKEASRVNNEHLV